MKKLPLILTLAVLAAFPQDVLAEAGIEQYEENAPTAGGDRPTSGGQTGGGDGGSGGGGGAAGSVGAGSEGSGGSTGSGGSSGFDTGGAAARDASGSRHGDGSQQTSTNEGVTSAAAEPGSRPLNPLRTGEDSPDEGGMGILLPIIVAASLVAALAFLVARRLRGRHQAA